MDRNRQSVLSNVSNLCFIRRHKLLLLIVVLFISNNKSSNIVVNYHKQFFPKIEFVVCAYIFLIIVLSLFIENKKQMYAAEQTAIDINCKTTLSQNVDKKYVMATINAQPISSGSRFPKILNGESFIKIYVAIRCNAIRIILRMEQEMKSALNP